VLIAKAITAIIAVIDPEMVVLGGGIGRAPGSAEAVARSLETVSPFVPELRVSARGEDAVVDGSLAAGLERAWSAPRRGWSGASRADPRGRDIGR